MAKEITIKDILTVSEIKRAELLYRKYQGTGQFNRKVVEQVINPVIGRINEALGQENDPRFLGYAVEYVFNKVRTK